MKGYKFGLEPVNKNETLEFHKTDQFKFLW